MRERDWNLWCSFISTGAGAGIGNNILGLAICSLLAANQWDFSFQYCSRMEMERSNKMNGVFILLSTLYETQ